MNTIKQLWVLTLLLASFSVFNPAFAADNETEAKAHEQHHPEAQTPKMNPTKKQMGHNGGMMGGMDMNQMKGMMHECMEMHKDGKMCDHEMMDKCQEGNMSKAQCQKMMKQAKAQEKTKKK